MKAVAVILLCVVGYLAAQVTLTKRALRRASQPVNHVAVSLGTTDCEAWFHVDAGDIGWRYIGCTTENGKQSVLWDGKIREARDE